MNFQQFLNDVADSYRARGYEVVVEPGPDALPDFAKDFKVEILAKRGDGCVLATAKKNHSDFEADHELPRYAEIIQKHPGWRYDLMVMGPEIEPLPIKGEAREPSEEDIRRALTDVERMLQAGFVSQALIAAWAVLETALRRRLQAEGEEAGWESSPRSMLSELYSSGMLENSVFRELETLFQVRRALIHGFTIPAIENSAVLFLVETAQMLLDESRAARKTA
jgi:hypothetical protein